MDPKNLMPQVAGLVNGTTTPGELPAPELAELSEEDLQQIVGGWVDYRSMESVTAGGKKRCGGS